jgi:hypothetical protein
MMLSKFRTALTFANVTSLLALVVALGGTAYAVGKLQPESVKSGHIARGAIKPKHLPAGVIDHMKIAGHTVFTPLSEKPPMARAAAYGEVQEVFTDTITSTEAYETTVINARCRQTADSGKFTVTPSTPAQPNPVLHLAGARGDATTAAQYWNTTTVSSKNTDADNEGVTISVTSKSGGGTAWVHLYCTNTKTT